MTVPIVKFAPDRKRISGFYLLTGVILFIILTASSEVYGQKETANWFFGKGVGLDFNSSVPATIPNSSIYTDEGSASISDSTGKLLFYTDGEKVWNKMHQVMVNGTGLWGNWTTSQSALIVKQPSTNLYYIFTVDFQAGFFGGYGGIAYSIVDMNLQNGLGEVTTKNIPLLTPTAEKVTGVHHRNGTDIWILAQHWGSNAKYAWLLTSSGLNKTPVISRLGIIQNNPINGNGQAKGIMKFSHNGKKVASAMGWDGIIELYDFDDSTGIVSNLKTINEYAYGLEFSPNDSILYANSTSYLFQFNIALTTEQQINNSRFLIYQIPFSPVAKLFGSLQLALNSKIYVGRLSSDTLAVINKPNALGASCNYQNNSISINPRRASFGFPNFVQSLFFPKPKKPDPTPTDSINIVADEEGISIKPLPYTSNYLIDINPEDLTYVDINLYNEIGQLILSKKEDNITEKYSTVINLDRYAKAIYFIVVRTNKERVIRKVLKL